MSSLHHTPVLLEEMIHFLSPQDGHTYLDATFGAGSYTKKILSLANCNVIACDQDPDTMPYASQVLKNYPKRFKFYSINFQFLDQVIESRVDGIVFDIGVSNMQLNNKHRGFSFQEDGPLDMRMNNEDDTIFTVKSIINDFSQECLADIIFNYGNECYSRRIAKAIKYENDRYGINSTVHLAQVIRRAIGKSKIGKIDSATKTFQALRIFVNDEINTFYNALKKASKLLNYNARIIAVTFHSLEDEVMKKFLKQHSQKTIAVSKYAALDKKKKLIDQHNKANNITPIFQVLTKKPVVPSLREVKANPGARSAKLRAAIKII